MARDDGNVSRYLLRRLRSLQEALRERAKRPQIRPQDRSGDRPSDAAGADKPLRQPGGESDRDV